MKENVDLVEKILMRNEKHAKREVVGDGVMGMCCLVSTRGVATLSHYFAVQRWQHSLLTHEEFEVRVYR